MHRQGLALKPKKRPRTRAQRKSRGNGGKGNGKCKVKKINYFTQTQSSIRHTGFTITVVSKWTSCHCCCRLELSQCLQSTCPTRPRLREYRSFPEPRHRRRQQRPCSHWRRRATVRRATGWSQRPPRNLIMICIPRVTRHIESSYITKIELKL